VHQFREQPTGPAIFIAIEGATGAGKTTLATRLSEQLGASVALDPFDQNPFLPGYYQAAPGQRASVALPMEMSFLAFWVGALRGIARKLSQGCLLVADWALIKSRVFAALTLSAADAGLFAQTLDLWAADLPEPDLIVYLRADAQILAARVRSRGRGIEKDLAAAELAEQDRLFTSVLSRTGLNVVTVDAAAFDVFSDRDLASLIVTLLRARRPAAA
jgi:deoxyadenosine/deoxycytidine kinase